MRISYDSCVRAIMMILRGYTIACVAERTLIPLRTLYRVWHNYNTYGTVHKPRGADRVRKLGQEDLQWLRNFMWWNSTLYLDEIQQAIWFHRSKHVSPSTLVRAFKAMGWTLKKNFPVAREASPQLQARYLMRMGTYSAEQLVFLDEVRTDKRTQTRRHARAPAGVRARGFGHFVRAAMCMFGVLAHFTIEGSFNSERLCEFAQDYLIPRMQPYPAPCSVLVLDNASTHHAPEFVDKLRARGLVVEFLPPYSPMLNPIEELFGTLKTNIRRVSQDPEVNRSDLLIIYRAFSMIKIESCCAWIRRAGYVVR